MQTKYNMLGISLLAVLLTACGPDGNGGLGIRQQDVEVNVNERFSQQQWSYISPKGFKPELLQMSQLERQEERELVMAINAERRKGGYCEGKGMDGEIYPRRNFAPQEGKDLKIEGHIYAAAKEYANILNNQNREGHYYKDDIDLSTPAHRMVKNGYKPLPPTLLVSETGEIIRDDGQLFFMESLAYGQLTAEEVINDWKEESYDHCVTIYEPLVYGAVAVVDAKAGNKYQGGKYWVFNVSGNMSEKE